MNKKSKDKNISEMIYHLTQERIYVNFSHDFEGMIAVTFSDEHLNHAHCGKPHGSLEDMFKDVRNVLAKKLESLE